MASVHLPAAITEGFELLSARDLDAWVELFTEDARLHELPDMPDAGVFVGHAGIRRWAEGLIEVSEEWNWGLVGALAHEGDIIITEAKLDVRGARSEVLLALPVFHVSEMEGGKIATVRAFSSRAQAFDAAGLEDPDPA